MDLTSYINGGIGIFAIASIIAIIKVFLAHINKNNDRMDKMLGGFNNTLNNHLDHLTKQSIKSEATQDKLCEAIERLIDKLK